MFQVCTTSHALGRYSLACTSHVLGMYHLTCTRHAPECSHALTSKYILSGKENPHAIQRRWLTQKWKIIFHYVWHLKLIAKTLSRCPLVCVCVRGKCAMVYKYVFSCTRAPLWRSEVGIRCLPLTLLYLMGKEGSVTWLCTSQIQLF